MRAAQFPKQGTLPKGPGNKERKAMGIEMAAMAYVAMENGEYVYAIGTRQPRKDSPERINKSELMRLAGYAPSCWDQWSRVLEKHEDFWHLVELYRIRRTDPMFRKEQEHMLLGKVLRNLSLRFYEISEYAPHMLSIRDTVMGMKAIVDMGYTVSKTDGEGSSRANKLLDSLPKMQREQAIKGLKEKLKSDLADVEALEGAHKAADDSQDG